MNTKATVVKNEELEALRAQSTGPEYLIKFFAYEHLPGKPVETAVMSRRDRRAAERKSLKRKIKL